MGVFKSLEMEHMRERERERESVRNKELKNFQGERERDDKCEIQRETRERESSFCFLVAPGGNWTHRID